MCFSFKFSLSTNNSYCYTFILGFQLLLCYFNYLLFGISAFNFVYFKSIFHDCEHHLRPILNLHCSCFEHFKSSSLSFVNNHSSVQFSHSVMSDPLWPHGLQYSRLPWPSLSPRTYLNSCPSSQWCHPTISSSVIPFSSCLQSFPASGSFQMSQFFASSGQSIGVPKARLYLVWIHTTFFSFILLFNLLIHLYYMKNMGNKENWKIKALPG